MKQWYKVIFLSLFFILFVTIFILLIWINNKVENDKLVDVSDNILSIFRHEMDLQKSNALFLSVALSEDKELKVALLDDDEESGYELLLNRLKKLKRYTFLKDIRTQLITSDLDIFARSWDNSYAGMPLDGLRADLHLIKKLREPKVSIDPGRLLSIKATTPIKDEDKIVGFIEAIKTFDEITIILRKRDIELSVLMYVDYLKVATLMRENPSFSSLVLSNRNYNQIVFNDIKKIKPEIFEQENYTQNDKYLHIFEPMNDGNGKKIGFYVLSISKNKISKYDTSKDNISFFLNISKEDLYKIEKNRDTNNLNIMISDKPKVGNIR